MEDKQNSCYDELVDVSKSVMSSYQTTDEEIHNLEEASRLQSKCKLWSIHREGRITASNFKSAVRTNPNKPSVSLVKNYAILSSMRLPVVLPSGDVNMKQMQLRNFLIAFRSNMMILSFLAVAL